MDAIAEYLQRAAAHGAAQEMGVLDFNDDDHPPELQNVEFADGALHVIVTEGEQRVLYRVDLNLVRIGEA